MNPRVKELAKQSGFYFYDLHNIDGQDYGETIEADSWTAAEKFAKLIIQECIDIAHTEGDKIDYLKNYFGVEE
jgi:hypothetical protein